MYENWFGRNTKNTILEIESSIQIQNFKKYIKIVQV